MDGREFLEATDATSPFRYIPRLCSTAEGFEDKEYDVSPFSNLPRLSSEVEVEEESFLSGLSRKISFQDIMCQRDYGLLAPPTQLSSDNKKGSYHDINKRQRIIFLENLIQSAMGSAWKEAEEENISSHSRLAAFARSNNQYQKMIPHTKETSIASHTTDIVNHDIAVDFSIRTRRTGNVSSSSRDEIQVNPNTARPSTISPILPPPQSLAPPATDHRRLTQRRMRGTTEDNPQGRRRGGRSHSPKQCSMPTPSNSTSRSSSPKHKSLPTTPSRRKTLSPQSGSHTRANNISPLQAKQRQPPLVVAHSPADSEIGRRTPRRLINSSSRMADKKVKASTSEEHSSPSSSPSKSTRNRDCPTNDHNSSHRRRTIPKEDPPSSSRRTVSPRRHGTHGPGTSMKE
jgi:hypothetical protein